MKDRSSYSSNGGGNGSNIGAPAATIDTNNDKDDYNDRINQRSQRYKKYTRKRSLLQVADQTSITSSTPFLVLVALLAVALSIQFLIVFSWHHTRHDVHVLGILTNDIEIAEENFIAQTDALNEAEAQELKDPATAHLVPHLPPLPPILNTRNIPKAQTLMDDTYSGKHPTIAGISLILDKFLQAMHESNKQLATHGKELHRNEVHEAFVKLAQTHLAPFETTYRDKPIFPIRDDDSVFISLASFRDHLLGDTLKGAFDQAKHPDKLFIGAIVQNCFGLNPYPGEPGVQCRTGAQVVGKVHGRDQTKVSDAPPDRNGIEQFCTNPKYKPYCDKGHIRVLYLHENESLGPAMARYYASKLWGGESFFMQVDSHLEFYTHWDELYTNEVKSAKSFPKAVLSSYPPGFQNENGGILEREPTPGARLCTCSFSDSDVEAKIIRINSGVGYSGGEEHPTQIPFIAAGFFFTPAGFLVDVPFDPYMPWCFMGEEIMLSMRSWTHGWDIYAPRMNWIAHQYRPGRMGLPKFWGSVGRLFGRPGPGFSNQLQLRLIKRVKHLVGYKDCCTREKLTADGDELVLTDVEHYGFGDVRSREEYLNWANINVDANRCRSIKWCNNGELL